MRLGICTRSKRADAYAVRHRESGRLFTGLLSGGYDLILRETTKNRYNQCLYNLVGSRVASVRLIYFSEHGSGKVQNLKEVIMQSAEKPSLYD